MNYYTDEEFEALSVSSKYKFYKDYVEQLEKDHDELLDENEKLKKKNKALKMENTKLKNKVIGLKKGTLPIHEADFKRLREQNIKLLDENKSLKRIIAFRGGKK